MTYEDKNEIPDSIILCPVLWLFTPNACAHRIGRFSAWELSYQSEISKRQYTWRLKRFIMRRARPFLVHSVLILLSPKAAISRVPTIHYVGVLRLQKHYRDALEGCFVVRAIMNAASVFNSSTKITPLFRLLCPHQWVWSVQDGQNTLLSRRVAFFCPVNCYSSQGQTCIT